MDNEPKNRPDDASEKGLPLAVKEVVYRSVSAQAFVAGRREFFKYRDLGIAAATDGQVSINVTKGDHGIQPTGWHYHICDLQFIYMLSGWFDVEFEDGTRCHLVAGDSICIPSGFRHNETDASKDFELVEVLMPAGLKTIPCDAPEGLR